MFSAFNPPGTNPVYNYIRTFDFIDCNKLFILDNYGERGCYYLGQNKSFSVEASVASLIMHIANQHEIPYQNIIACGSSKGGYASLYFGIKYGFGHVICGAPQTLLGNYISFAAPETMRYIAGDNSDESKLYLNNLLFDLVKESKRLPNICIHVGKGDHHYVNHVIPLVKEIKEKGYAVELDLLDFSDHGEVKYYQDLLKKKIPQIIPGSLIEGFRIKQLNVVLFNDCLKAKVLAVGDNILYAWYVIKNNERIHVQWYSDSNQFDFKVVEKGKYKIISFIKDKAGNVQSETSQVFHL